MYIYVFINIYYIFYLTYASKVRAACIARKAPIRLLWKGRSCLAFVRSGMSVLGIEPKGKLSCLFNPVSIQE